MSSSFQARNAVTLLKKQLDDATVQSSSGWMHIWCTPSFCIIASRECQHFGRECRFLCWDMLGPFCAFCKCLARRWSKLFIACRLPQAARDRERPLNNATVIYSAITYCLHAFTSRFNTLNRWGVPNVVSSSPPGILESPTLGAGQSCKTETPSLSMQWQV